MTAPSSPATSTSSVDTDALQAYEDSSPRSTIDYRRPAGDHPLDEPPPRRLNFVTEISDTGTQTDTVTSDAASTVEVEISTEMRGQTETDEEICKKALRHFTQHLPSLRKNRFASFIGIVSEHHQQSKEFTNDLAEIHNKAGLFERINQFKTHLSTKTSIRTLNQVNNFILQEKSYSIKDRAILLLNTMPKSRNAIPLFSGYNKKLIESYISIIQNEAEDEKIIGHLLELQKMLSERKSIRCHRNLTEFINQNNFQTTRTFTQ